MSRTIWVTCLAILTMRLLPGVGSLLAKGVYAATFGERYIAYELLGAVFIFAAVRPGWSIWARSALYGLLIGLLFLRVPDTVRPFPALFAATALLGVGAIVAAAERAVKLRTASAARVLAVMTAPAAFHAVLLWTVSLTPSLMPQTRDALLYIFDAGYGVQLSFLTGRLFENLPLLSWAAYRVYIAVPLAVVGLYAIWLSRRQKPQVNIMVMTGLLCVAGYLLYPAIPACGPVYQFGTAFPDAPPNEATMSGAPLPLSFPAAPRNCMPSLHLSWALMLLLNTRTLGRRIRAVAAVFFTFTALATLGLGEHYFVDLVVAVPFTVAIQGVCYRLAPAFDGRRLVLIAWGAGATAAWLVFLRFGMEFYRNGFPIAWVASAITVAVSLALERRLASRRLNLVPEHRAAAVAVAAGANPAATGEAA